MMIWCVCLPGSRRLETFLASDDGANLLAGYRRANSIVRIEQKKDEARNWMAMSTMRSLEGEEERVLYDGSDGGNLSDRSRGKG